MRFRLSTLCLTLVASLALAQDPRLEELSESERTWLEEEVVYIIAPREREAFLSLSSAEERRFFVDAFWRRRDPNPVTPANEFQEEHYRRFAYANSKLDAESLLPGWKTERGRMYIILGDPRSIERFSMENELVSTELWFYEGDTSKGLPPFFNLLFFKRMDTGEYRLYSPSADGPQALLRGRFAATPQAAIRAIERVSPELARASLSIEARAGGDIETGVASLENETTMMRIEDSPTYAVRTDDLDGWELFGDRVAAEYSFNFVPSRSTFAVLPGAEGGPFVHFSIELEPESFSVETVEGADTFYTSLDVSVEVRDPDGALIYADDKETYIELTRSELESIRRAPIAYQDRFPVIAGEHSVSVILKNRVHSRFTVAEEEISVSSTPAISDVVLGYLAEPRPTHELSTFQFGEVRVHPSAEHVFTEDEWLQGLMHVKGDSGARLRFVVTGDDGVVSERESLITDYADGWVSEAFELSDLVSGYYRFAVELVDGSGTSLAAVDVPFLISPRTSIPRPNFIIRRQFPSDEPGRTALTLAEQLQAAGRLDDAVGQLERSFAQNPNLFRTRTLLAAAYNRRNEPARAIEILLPLASLIPEDFDVAMGLGVAFYLENDFEKAVPHFERAIALRPPNASQLNALGNSYVRLGRSDDARAVYERSLAIDPGQKSVEAALAALDNLDYFDRDI